MIRNATALWQGTGKDGKGNITTQSNFIDHVPYSSKSRFDNEIGTNPEELIAGAHAGCFTMKLAYVLEAAGFTPESMQTTCEITIEEGVITTSHLILKAKIAGIDGEKFMELVQFAKDNCPVSKVLNAAISVESSLEE